MAEATIKYPAGEMQRAVGAGEAPGDVVLHGNRIAVLTSLNVAVGDMGCFATAGVFEMGAENADIWADGDLLYWDDTNKVLTDVPSTHKSAGLAVGGKGSGETIARVDLNASVASGTI